MVFFNHRPGSFDVIFGRNFVGSLLSWIFYSLLDSITEFTYKTYVKYCIMQVFQGQMTCMYLYLLGNISPLFCCQLFSLMLRLAISNLAFSSRLTHQFTRFIHVNPSYYYLLIMQHRLISTTIALIRIVMAYCSFIRKDLIKTCNACHELCL